MKLLSIEQFDREYLYVEITAATEMSFCVKIPPQGVNYLIKDLCRIAPIFRRLDMDLMEAFDDAFRIKPSDRDINTIAGWLMLHEVKNVDCGVIDYIKPFVDFEESRI
jgi:hypothetical protein